LSQPTGTDAGLSDEHLLQLIQDRKLDALSHLYDRHAGQALGLANKIVRDRETAEEVLQDVFLSVWRQAHTYDAKAGRVKPWLMSIVHHRAIDRIRRLQNKPQPVPLDDAWMKAAPTNTELEAMRSVEGEYLRSLVSKLPAEQRHAIDLAYFNGNTFVEIARMTGAPVGTVKSRVRLGLGKLREMLAT
jgi:RNA polymerase sigma-70 factor (ECF subfamily)